MEATAGSASSPPSPLPVTPDQKLPQCLPSLLLSGEVNPEALLGAQAAERGVYGSRGPSFAGILGTQAPGGAGGKGAGSAGARVGRSHERDPCRTEERPVPTRGDSHILLQGPQTWCSLTRGLPRPCGTRASEDGNYDPTFSEP